MADEDGEQGGWRFHAFQYICFGVPDLEAVLARVKSTGGTIDGDIDTMPWGERLF